MTRLRLQLEGAAQILVAAFVVAIGLAVSNVDVLNIPIAREVRWAALAELGFVALLYAATSVRRPRFPVPFVVVGVFVAIALLSAAWSPDPKLTLGRAATVGALFVTAGALAFGSTDGSDGVRPFLLGILGGTVAIAAGGVVELAFRSDRAIVPATIGQGARYNGLGANPDTLSMLFAVVLPLGLWAFVEARARWEKVAAIAALLLLDGSLAASSSRAMVVGALAGIVAFVFAMPFKRRLRVGLVAAGIALFAINVGVGELPRRSNYDPLLNKKFGGIPVFSPAHDAQLHLPLQDEIGFPKPGAPHKHRTLFDAGGRMPAWRGAVRQADQRPLVGYGFGTEERVFVDRYYPFLSDRPENSYIGMLLQLGFVGLLSLLAVIGSILWFGVRVLRRLPLADRTAAAACLAVFVTGVIIAISQSYLTSVGSPAAAPVWLCGFLLVGIAAATP